MVDPKLVKKVRDLATTGLRPAQIAIRLGVSRQWVYVICGKYEIAYPGRGMPMPDVTTGVVTPLNSTLAGAVSELIVACDLLARGYWVYRSVVNHRGHDLIACKDGILKTFEVRSAKRSDDGQLRASRKNELKSDCLAFVVAGEPIIYNPPID